MAANQQLLSHHPKFKLKSGQLYTNDGIIKQNIFNAAA